MEREFLERFVEAIEIEGEHKLTTDTVFRNMEEWNSLAFLSLIAMIDEEYGVIIEGNDFRKLNTIGDVIAEIKKRKNIVEEAVLNL